MLQPTSQPNKGTAWAFLPAIGLAILASAVAVVAQYAPPETGEIAVVFPPFTDEGTAWQHVVEAGGKVIAPSRFSNIVIAYAPDPGFADRVRAANAWFTVAATGLCRPLFPISDLT